MVAIIVTGSLVSRSKLDAALDTLGMYSCI